MLKYDDTTMGKQNPIAMRKQQTCKTDLVTLTTKKVFLETHTKQAFYNKV
jgi:hypothetical protein